jgi:DMSO/TMAO reductase YedYZ molybdopterin-dependent catalytic subunit
VLTAICTAAAAAAAAATAAAAAAAAAAATGTSLSMHYALDDANDVLVAYKQNDRWLTPDHGFPVRMIIPGFIGGRMVKWLAEITVTEAESNNFYHFHDNRVMPPHVDEELAKKEGECERVLLTPWFHVAAAAAAAAVVCARCHM